MPTYTAISSEAFRHPLDKQAEQALRSVPGFDLVARTFIEYLYERPQKVFLMGNNIKAGVRQYSTLYGIFRECLKDLDLNCEPILYVNQNPSVNSYALGDEMPYIVVNTALMDLLTEAELRCVIAHELGHIKCGHTILIQMAIWVMNAASWLGDLTLGIGNIITTGLILAFYEWRRKAELSADRAALLVMDDLNPILTCMMKMAGGSVKYGHECNIKEFELQADQYQNLNQDNLNQIYKFLLYNGGNGAFLTHPFPVERIKHIREWYNSSEYLEIKRGNYKRTTEGSVDVNSSEDEAETLRRQIEQLKAEIDRIKSDENSH